MWHPCMGLMNFCRRAGTRTRVLHSTLVTGTSHPTLVGAPFLFIQKNKPQIKLNTKKHSSPIALKNTKRLICLSPKKFISFLKNIYNSPNGATRSLCLFPNRSLSADETPETSQYLDTILKAFSSRTRYLLLSSSPANSPKVIILAVSRPQFS